jgi:hypothetical protein
MARLDCVGGDSGGVNTTQPAAPIRKRRVAARRARASKLRSRLRALVHKGGRRCGDSLGRDRPYFSPPRQFESDSLGRDRPYFSPPRQFESDESPRGVPKRASCEARCERSNTTCSSPPRFIRGEACQSERKRPLEAKLQPAAQSRALRLVRHAMPEILRNLCDFRFHRGGIARLEIQTQQWLGV